MSNAILFTATDNDWEELRSFIFSLDLRIVPTGPGLANEDGKIQGGFLSPLPESQLTLTKLGHYCEVLDPLLSFYCGASMPGYFRPGRITQNLDVDRLAAQTKSNFGRLSRWIRKNWPKLEGTGTWCGSEAKELIQSEGLIVTDFVPDVTINYVPIQPNQPLREQDA